jgi:hypothetical protein
MSRCGDVAQPGAEEDYHRERLLLAPAYLWGVPPAGRAAGVLGPQVRSQRRPRPPHPPRPGPPRLARPRRLRVSNQARPPSPPRREVGRLPERLPRLTRSRRRRRCLLLGPRVLPGATGTRGSRLVQRRNKAKRGWSLGVVRSQAGAWERVAVASFPQSAIRTPQSGDRFVIG